ncbi:diacylglycerol/lipid kinase family protein [Pseudoalteromonas pernae]|uniref:diacylglycerol/lipid kinase family protein n=1 Tax=Pseudoalteromonas pernae TaxID=3118054 RepID=UPI0032429858
MSRSNTFLILYHPLQTKSQLKNVRQHLDERALDYCEMATSGDFCADLHSLQSYHGTVSRVIVLGGDGTLNLAVNAFANSTLELALVPCGSGNDFARQWRCDERQWLEAALFGESSYIDLGKVNERYFINIAGVGYDAAVVKACSGKRGPWAHLSYAWQGVRMLYRYAPSILAFSSKQSHQKQLLMMCLANGQYFGGGMRLAPSAKIADGFLQCVQIGAASFWRQCQALILSYQGKHAQLPQVDISKTEQLQVHTANIGIEADGEYIGTTPATFSVQKSALRFVVPSALG